MIGVLGGVFDPPHNGHVALAGAALDQLGLERLEVLVVADPGHKATHADQGERRELARVAFAELPVTVALDDHPRTVDLLRRRRWGGDPLFIVGADEFSAFLSWKEPEEVLRLARLAVATRPGYPRDRLDAVLAQLAHPERVRFFEIPSVAVSSTEVRRRIAAGEPVDDLVPRRVAELVQELGLYRR